MARFDHVLDSRQNVADWYNQKLSAILGVEIPHVSAHTSRMSWFVYVIRFAETIDRDVMAKQLKEKGIPVRPYFLPIHLQPYMAEMFGYKSGDYPVTEDLGRRSLALPFSGVMTEGQVDLVCEAIAGCLE
jgi:dTDP-4-amino-4,6-dideoxygalactose transaminase